MDDHPELDSEILWEDEHVTVAPMGMLMVNIDMAKKCISALWHS